MESQKILDEIAAEVKNCENCKLHSSRKHSVPGEGPANAEIMFIGEGPGFHENEQGRPFVGAAGKFLTELLASIGLKREDVFIANVVKCRPPGNRDPEPDELAACDKYLERQITAINPHLIVTLGRVSMGKFLQDVRISNVHGQARWVNERLIVTMYHPAAALHQPALRSTIEQDFSHLPVYVTQSKQKHAQVVLKPGSDNQPADSEATQLSLF